MKGHSEKHKQKLREVAIRNGYRPPSWKGKKHSAETIQKMKNKVFTVEHLKKLSIAQTRNKHSIETKRKIGEAQKGEKSHFWMGGISKNPYPKEFNSILKLKIRQRDNFICCLCKRTEREELEELNRVLSVNHIDFDKNNCKEKNLNTLCARCNLKINREREYWTNYFNTFPDN